MKKSQTSFKKRQNDLQEKLADILSDIEEDLVSNSPQPILPLLKKKTNNAFPKLKKNVTF